MNYQRTHYYVLGLLWPALAWSLKPSQFDMPPDPLQDVPVLETPAPPAQTPQPQSQPVVVPQPDPVPQAAPAVPTNPPLKPLEPSPIPVVNPPHPAPQKPPAPKKPIVVKPLPTPEAKPAAVKPPVVKSPTVPVASSPVVKPAPQPRLPEAQPVKPAPPAIVKPPQPQVISVQSALARLRQNPDHRIQIQAPTQLMKGSPLQFSITVQRRCTLSVLSISSDGGQTLLFPNRAHPEALLQAGERVQVPAENSIQLKTLGGDETLVAFCRHDDKPLYRPGYPVHWQQPFVVLNAGKELDARLDFAGFIGDASWNLKTVQVRNELDFKIVPSR